MLHLLDPEDPGAPFPDVELAEAEPNGLLAIGGDLSPARLIQAYRQGIFPWYSEGQPILWWSPNPRTVLIPEELKVSRSLRKTLRRGHFTVTMDHAFGQVVRECAAPRSGESGTWLVPEMQLAYIELHREHIAHSVEVWRGETLVGGLYGVAFGQVFYGESMFSRETDASKVALVYLTQRLLEWGYRLIDCQVYTDHLIRLGAREIDRREFTAMLGRWADSGGRRGSWDLGPQETPPLAVMHQTRA